MYYSLESFLLKKKTKKPFSSYVFPRDSGDEGHIDACTAFSSSLRLPEARCANWKENIKKFAAAKRKKGWLLVCLMGTIDAPLQWKVYLVHIQIKGPSEKSSLYTQRNLDLLLPCPVGVLVCYCGSVCGGDWREYSKRVLTAPSDSKQHGSLFTAKLLPLSLKEVARSVEWIWLGQSICVYHPSPLFCFFNP